MADNNFDTVKSELDEIYGLLQSLANNISGLNASAANLRKAADDTSRSAKEASNSTKSELNEYKAVLGDLADKSKDLTKSIEKGKSLLKNSYDLVDSSQRAIQDSMTFSNKSMSEAFSFGKKVSAYKSQADREIAEAQRNMNKVIEQMDEAIQNMKDAADASGIAVEDNAEYQKLLAERNAAVSRKLEIDNIKEIGYSRVKAQNELKTKAINMLKGAIDTIAAYYQKAFANAYSSVMSAYENTYHDITSYNAYSKKEYNQVIDSMQAFIKENGLNESINMSDYLEEVKGVLQGGLTGPLAEQVAKYSILSKEGGISADFSDQSFQKMIKKVYDQKLQETGSEQEALAASEGLLEQIMTQSKAVIEETGDSFGFANGQINTMMNSIWEMSSIMNMTDEAVKKSTTSMTALNGVLGKTGMDTTAIYEQIEKYASEGFNGSSAQAMLNFSGMSSAQARAEIEKNGIGSMIEKTISGIYDKYSGNAGEFQKAINDALGSDYDLKSIQSMLSTYKTEEDFMKAYKGAMSAAQGADSDAYIAGLKEFNTEAEQLNNYAENAMTDTAQLAQESNLIRIGVDSLVDYFTGTKVSSMFGSIADWGNLLLNAFGKGGGGGSGTISGLKSLFAGGTGSYKSIGTMSNGFSTALRNGTSGTKAAANMLNNGASFGNVAKTAGLKNAAGGLMKSGALNSAASSAGPLMLAAGIAMGVKDSIGAGKSAAANWDSYTGSEKAAAVGNTALAFVTGHNANLTEDEKWEKAKKGEGSIDWSEAWSNAGKGALIVGGIGAMAGSAAAGIGAAPGALIGGLIGGVSGFVANVAHQKAVMDKYNDFVESEMYNMGERLTELTKTTTKSIGAFGDLERSLQEQRSIEQTLADAKAGYTDLTKDEITQLEIRLNLLKMENDMKLQELGDVGQVKTSVEDFINQAEKAQSDMQTFTDVTKALKDKGWDKDTDFHDLSDKELKEAISDKQIKEWVKHNVTKDEQNKYKNKEDLYRDARIALLQEGTGGDNLVGKDMMDKFSAGETWNFATMKGGTNSEFYKASKANYTAATSGIQETYSAGAQNLGIYNDESDNKQIRQALSAYAYGLWGYRRLGDSKATLDGTVKETPLQDLLTGMTSDGIAAYTAWLANQKDVKVDGYFKTGLSYVPYDGFRAILHKGERVQTAAEVNLEKANYAADGSSKMATALQDSLVRQTDVIIGLLQNILGAISGKSHNASEYMEELNAYSYTVGLPSNS